MKRLGGLDSLFVTLESPTSLFHVGAVGVFDPSTAPPGSPPPFEGIRRVLEQRLHLLGPFRQRLVRVPGSLDHPRWIEDPDLDLDNHVLRGALPAPGGPSELADYVSGVMSTPLAPDRPLWEIHIVEGLEGGLVAGVAKIHHAAIDGLSSVDLTANLMDLKADAPPAGDAPARPEAEPEPSGLTLVRDSLLQLGKLVPSAAATLGRGALVAARMGRRNRRPDALAPPSLFHAPSTPFSAPLGSRRNVGLVHLDRDEIEEVRAATGTTFNDVLLTITGGVLRSYLRDHGALPERQLTAMVPVSVRDEGTPADAVNRLSGLIVGLATTIADPVDRLSAVRDGFDQAKEQDAILGPDMVGDLCKLALPCVLGPAMGAFTRLGVTQRWPMFNVVVSSFPGSPVPLFCAGGRMEAYHPFGPIIHGAALNVTAMSYLDRVGIGLLACKKAAPDIGEMADRFPDALTELLKAVAA